MSITIEATYENGVLKPKQPLELPKGAEVRLTVLANEDDVDPLDAVIGICKEGPNISLAERHDEFLYGLKRQEGDSL